MTVHMFRVFVGLGSMSLTDLETRMDDWVASNPAWDADTAEHAVTERDTATDGTGETFYAIDVRFTEDETKDNLLQKLSDKVENKVAWYRAGYHACEHDQEHPSPCTWDDRVQWTAKGVSIPPGVPEVSP